MSAHRWTIHDVPCAAGCGADDITCEHCGLCQDCVLGSVSLLSRSHARELAELEAELEELRRG